jgi:hypothetical protein
VGSVSFTTMDWSAGDTFKTAGVEYEILDTLDVPEEMNSEYVGILLVSSLELAEPG